MLVRKLLAVLTATLLLAPVTSLAADRAQAMSDEPYELVAASQPASKLPTDWQKKIYEGAVLDLDLYKQGQVVYRDPLSGVVSLRLGNKVVRVMADSRKIIDIFTTL